MTDEYGHKTESKCIVLFESVRMAITSFQREAEIGRERERMKELKSGCWREDHF